MSYRVHRSDANTREIVEGLRRAGRSVLLIGSSVPGVPDVLVGYRGFMVLADIKKLAPPAKMPRKRKAGNDPLWESVLASRREGLTAGAARSRENQRKWAASWKGVPVQEWHTLAEALAGSDPGSYPESEVRGGAESPS